MAECGEGDDMATGTYRDGRIFRFIIGRKRLLASTLAGLILLALLPDDFRPSTRFILAWDLTALLYIALIMWMIRCSTVEDCHDHAALNDEGDWVILLLVIAGVAASFICIAVELPMLQSPRHSLQLGIFVTGLTVILSWTFAHTVFTLHYANVYDRPDADGPGGLHFPGHREPDYRDFLHYSFVIGCASQTGDVATVSRAMRHMTMVHGIVSFAFNTAILALTINVGASLLS
ncbi:MAG: DUF1345 domain-containing protein [Rhodospirillales bacterium]|nr:DUF1345 domain-containing protein [Rhodospirillales bacterium]